jgi:DNA-binding transcriptional ArsR family regulator
MKPESNHTATLEQIQALGNETRLRIFHYLTEGECSEAELAERIGVPAKSLYYHIRLLLKVNLIRQTGMRQVAKKPQALYRAVADNITLGSKEMGAEGRAAVAQNVRSVLRIASREVSAAMAEEGSAELCAFTRQRLILTKESIARFRADLDDLTEAYSQPVEGGLVVCFTAAVAPRKSAS